MARLTHRNGAVVDVSDEKAALLLSQGFTPVESDTKKAPAKKATSPTPKK